MNKKSNKVISLLSKKVRLVLLPIFILLLAVYGCKEEESEDNNSAGPSPPSNLTASAGNGSITLNWDTSAGATSYNIYYLTYPGVNPTNSKQITGAKPGQVVRGMDNEKTYYFIVTAVNGGGESSPTTEVSATPMPPLAGIPDNLYLYAGVASVELTWNWVVDAESYNVYYGTSPGVTTASSQNIKDILDTEVTISGLTNAPGHYYFIVTAVNASGEGEPSDEMVATAIGGYKSVSAGLSHSSALRIIENKLASINNGSVWVWGENSSGQLGQGNEGGNYTTARKTAAINSATAVASGVHHTVALKTEQTVMSWGNNEDGQLGRGYYNPNNESNGIPVSGLTDVIAIAAGRKHNVALKNNSSVWTWGLNTRAQLGEPSLNCQEGSPIDPLTWSCNYTPVNVSSVSGTIREVAAGYDHSMAIDEAGDLFLWGNNDSGQLTVTGSNCPDPLPSQYSTVLGPFNDATRTCSRDAVRVDVTGDFIAAAGGLGHTVAVTDLGIVWAWGKNDQGQLGYDADEATTDVYNITCDNNSATPYACRTRPIAIPGLTNIVAIAAGLDHNVALKNDGTVWTWGKNDEGQLGNGTFTAAKTPVPQQVSGLEGIISIAAGEKHSIALKNNGTAWAWGYNNRGQLGNGSTSRSTSPVQVQGLDDPVVVLPGLMNLNQF